MSSGRRKIFLVLEDGTAFPGELFGHLEKDGRIGEVVFNTSLSGYQEVISDPSYRGQIVCFTYPSIGNYGINREDEESARPCLDGIIVRDYCETPSNWRKTASLEEYMKKNKITGICGVDTRALVRHIRERGSMIGGFFFHDGGKDADIIKAANEKIAKAPKMEGQNLTGIFNGRAANEEVARLIAKKNLQPENLKPVCTLDFGIKYSILSCLLDAGLLPEVFPGDTLIAKWENFNPDRYKGFFFSNGPGDPAAVTNGIANIREILAMKKPVFGICLGHQMLSLALDAETYKMKFGHHGGNQPVKDEGRSRVFITAQNHGFAAVEKSLREKLSVYKGVQIDCNPNDGSIEGFRINDPARKVLSVQYHPEAGPGPHDARFLFHDFAEMLR